MGECALQQTPPTTTTNVVGGIWAELPEPSRPAPEGKTWRFIGTWSSTGPWVQCLYNTTPPTCRPVRRAEQTPEEEPTSEEAAAENDWDAL